VPPDVVVLTSSPARAAKVSSLLIERGYSVAIDAWEPGTWEEKARKSGALVVVVDSPEVTQVNLDAIRRLCGPGPDSPRLVIVAPGSLTHRVQALNAGADACLSPESSARELSTRIWAILRRAWRGHGNVVLREGPLALDLLNRVVTYRGERVPVSEYEFRVLRDMALRIMEQQARPNRAAPESNLEHMLLQLTSYVEMARERAQRQPRHRQATGHETSGPSS